MFRRLEVASLERELCAETLVVPDRLRKPAAGRGVAEVARRFPVKTAILNIGAARVPEIGPYHLTMTSAEAVEAARAFGDATIVPLHFEGWAHFSEGREDIVRAFDQAGLAHRLRWA